MSHATPLESIYVIKLFVWWCYSFLLVGRLTNLQIYSYKFFMLYYSYACRFLFVDKLLYLSFANLLPRITRPLICIIPFPLLSVYLLFVFILVFSVVFMLHQQVWRRYLSEICLWSGITILLYLWWFLKPRSKTLRRFLSFHSSKKRDTRVLHMCKHGSH